MRRRTRIIVASAAVVSLGALIVVGCVQTDRYQRSHQTIARARLLVLGCGSYRIAAVNPEPGNYPRTLAELVTPPWGGGPFVLPPDDRLTDSWGNPFRYAVVTEAGGGQEVYVWAEREVRGKLQLLGAKRMSDGEVVLFGLPD